MSRLLKIVFLYAMMAALLRDSEPELSSGSAREIISFSGYDWVVSTTGPAGKAGPRAELLQ
jgi:hypothetical protein